MAASLVLESDFVLRRNRVLITGSGTRPILFAHGFGCDQSMWRYVAPEFERDHRVVLFDHVGCGASDRSAYRMDRYGSLDGYADDVLEICAAAALRDVIFVGHSVSAMIGVLAAERAPDLFAALVMVGPSPRYIDEPGYKGGFAQADVEELLELLERNHTEWSQQMAPLVMANPENPELARELANSFCRMDPFVARRFARVTFSSDTRDHLPRCRTPALILQCSGDVIAPVEVGEYLHRSMPDSRYVLMNATGHCPHLSAPQETIEQIRRYLNDLAARRPEPPAHVTGRG